MKNTRTTSTGKKIYNDEPKRQFFDGVPKVSIEWEEWATQEMALAKVEVALLRKEVSDLRKNGRQHRVEVKNDE